VDSEDPSTEQLKKGWGDYFELHADTRKVHSRLGWIISLSLLILTFIFFRIDYTDFAPKGMYTGPSTTILSAYGGAYGDPTKIVCYDSPDGVSYSCMALYEKCCFGVCQDASSQTCCDYKNSDGKKQGFVCGVSEFCCDKK